MSQNKNLFTRVQTPTHPSNTFNLSHGRKMSCNFGMLYPILVKECVPGDKWKISSDALVRMAPMIAPVMHKMDVFIHHWFVPYRLLWEGWESYITGQPGAGAHPFVTIYSPELPDPERRYTKLCDYMGIPIPENTDQDSTSINVNAMPFAAYQRIYHEWYRDQNLIAPNTDPILLESGEQDPVITDRLLDIKWRAWEHDYFTSALPWAQKGSPVEIPLIQNFEDVPVFSRGTDGTDTVLAGTPDDQILRYKPSTDVSIGELFADTSTLAAQSTTINALRRAMRLQEYLELLARVGSRYTEYLKGQFNVRPQDYRLQLPEYITGSKTPIVISEVLNTTGEDGGLPQGNMAGHGISVANGSGGYYEVKEDGCIISLLSIRPRPAYMQGLDKIWLKFEDRFQYYTPQFAHIGEQPIEDREIYAWKEPGNGVFGYTPRYAEYKFSDDNVAGDFRTSLSYWHMSRKFANAPALNQDFIECKPDYRIFAVTDPEIDHFYCNIIHSLYVRRQMSLYGTPSF